MSTQSGEPIAEPAQKPKLDVLQKEKAKKDYILQMRYQKEFILEQNKLKEAELKRTEVIVKEQEVSARSWKAYWEKMYYSMECEKLQPDYEKYQERAKQKIEKDKAEYDAMQKKLQEEMNRIGHETGEEIKLSATPELSISDLQKEEE
jgi:hypothetical protein